MRNAEWRAVVVKKQTPPVAEQTHPKIPITLQKQNTAWLWNKKKICVSKSSIIPHSAFRTPHLMSIPHS